MIEPAAFFSLLRDRGVDFVAGVPDSLLKSVCAYASEKLPRHVTAANEGNAVALAAGYYLASGRPALVYMQNSGLGNAVNPLLSLADPAVYGIPMVLLVGWRGRPGTKDEPQHAKQGEVSPALLDALQVPFAVLSAEAPSWEEEVSKLLETASAEKRPVALLAEPGAFAPFAAAGRPADSLGLTREAAIAAVAEGLPGFKFVSTTGFASRELYELREARGQGHGEDFLTVGSMGHALSIALGLCLSRPGLGVCCLDGDGAALMHLGGMAVAGSSGAEGLVHVVLNNGCHDSVGGQPTVGFEVDFAAIASACGYGYAASCSDAAGLADRLSELAGRPGPSFLEIKVARGARSDLGRPASSPAENMTAFRAALGEKA